MGQRHREDTEAERARIYQASVCGLDESEIARLLRLDRKRVARVVAAFTQAGAHLRRSRRWLVARELAHLAALEAEAWRAWDRSCQDREVVTTTRTGEGRVVVLVRTETRTGNPAFLKIVRLCIHERALLLDLYPKRRAVSADSAGAGQLSVALLDEILRRTRLATDSDGHGSE